MSATRELPVDAALPQLAILFDAHAMALELDRHATLQQQPCWRVAGCEIERVKYRPGRNCIVGYRVLARRNGGRRGVFRRVTVAMYPAQEARERQGRSPAALLPGLDALLWVFPQDRKLEALSALATHRRLTSELLPPIVASAFGAGARLHRTRSTVVSHFPEHSCTVRADLTVVAGPGGARRPWQIYGHVRYDDASARAAQAMRRLHDDPECAAAGLGFARPLHYDAGRRLLWQEGIVAPTLDALLRDPGPIPRTCLCGRVVRALAALHRTAPPVAACGDRPNTIEAIERAVDTVSRAVPACGDAARALGAVLLRTVPGTGGTPLATLHGDLHGNNVLVGADRVYLIDLDRIGAGPPLPELGGLLAEWITRDCVDGREPDWRLARAAVDAYRAGVPWSVTREEAGWCVAAALLHERAFRAVTSLKPGRLEALPRVLAAAKRVLEHGP